MIENKPARVEAIKKLVDEVRASGILRPCLASVIYGKLRYTESQIFGRGSLPYLRHVSQRAVSKTGVVHIDTALDQALDNLIDILQHSPPRKIDTSDARKPVLVFTDGQHDSRTGWGISM